MPNVSAPLPGDGAISSILMTVCTPLRRSTFWRLLFDRARRRTEMTRRTTLLIIVQGLQTTLTSLAAGYLGFGGCIE